MFGRHNEQARLHIQIYSEQVTGWNRPSSLPHI